MALDDFTRRQWYAIGRTEDFPEGVGRTTRLLGCDIVAERRRGDLGAWQKADGASLPIQVRYGHVWTTLSDRPVALYDIEEFEDPRRRLVTVGRVPVRCSGLRAMENFLDLAHLSFVHTDILGIRERAKVERYEVEVVDNELWATQCRFFQPKAAATADGGQLSEYRFRVPHPFSSILYKTCPIVKDGWDLIGLLVQPSAEDHCNVHSFVLVFDDESSDTQLLHFQQCIFFQDRVILENQVPALLPLERRRERSVPADATSVAYRRWLANNGVTYGAIPIGDGA